MKWSRRRDCSALCFRRVDETGGYWGKVKLKMDVGAGLLTVTTGNCKGGAAFCQRYRTWVSVD